MSVNSASSAWSASNVDVTDLYYQHGIDPDTPIEKIVAAMAELVKDTKVRFPGECSGETLRRAYKVHPIAVRSNGILPLVSRHCLNGP